MSIDPNTTGQIPGQAVGPAKPPTQSPGDAGDLMQSLGGVFTPLLHQLGSLMQSQGVEGVGDVKSQTTIEKAQDNSALLTGATQGQSIANPQLPDAVHADIDKFIDKFVLSIAGQNPFEGAANAELGKFALTLQVMRQTGNEGGSEGANSAGPVHGAQAAGGAGGPHPDAALAGLGGLVAVSLFEVLAKFAKTQSETEKLASELTILLHKAEIDGAKSQALIVEEKAAIAVAALIAQMIVGVAAASVQLGGTGYLMRGMQTGHISDTTANIAAPAWAAGSQMISAIGDKGAEAIKTMLTAPLEMQEILLRAYTEQISKASQSTDKLAADSHDLVAQALQLLDKMLDALSQNFNKIGH